MICLISGSAFAAGSEISRSRETENMNFYGITSAETAQVQTASNVQDFIANSGPSNKNLDLGEFLYESFRGGKAQSKPSEG